MQIGAEEIEQLAKELYELNGQLITAELGSDGYAHWRVDTVLRSLWGVLLDSEWIITGKATRNDYASQIELIKRIRPDWPKTHILPLNNNVFYFTILPLGEHLKG